MVRAEQVASLRESGLSIRAIASATGSSKNTVKSDIRSGVNIVDTSSAPKSDAELLAEALGDEPMRLARDERQEMVKVLSAEGMSTRAIAPVVGVSQKTVDRDTRQVSHHDSPPPKSDAELLAGAEWSPEAVEDEPRFTDEPGHVQPVTGTITGMDGKTYTRPAPEL